MPRKPGPSVRLRLTLSYAAVVVVTGALLLAVVWVFLLRYVPDGPIQTTGFVPNRGDLVDAFAPAAAAALAGLLLVGLLGGWLLAGRMLAPLDRLTAAARLAAGGSLAHRVRLPGRDDEFRELADAFDTMLARLEAQVGRQGRFAANASHELRTPLAITKAMLDVAARDVPADPGELVSRLQGVTTRAIELTEALLLLSRAENAVVPAEPVDLSLAAEEAAETMLPLAESRGVTIDVSGEPATAVGSPALLAQLVTSLVHNAVVHNVPTPGGAVSRGPAPGGAVHGGPEHDGPAARTGGAGFVTVWTGERDGSAVVVVENSGGLVAPDTVASLTEAFQRGGERVHDDHGGVGLGLAIVDAIVRAHAGRLELVPRPAGGLVVRVFVPRASSAPPLPRPLPLPLSTK
ncbi:sensor histidine kinase [Frigoribacterium sp. 2-23]|uniref:sensor histidine kinase n=1 Tax=Frigoribacterium sp. 2-23 TaxID=3415006 RepID=UPI003C6F25DB